MHPKDALGRYGERLAARHLQAAGIEVVECNWRSPIGEIDIVARDGDALVVCEVKTRRGLAYGHPAEAITPAKAARLRRLTRQWLLDHTAEDGSWHPATLRIDVVAVLVPRRGAPVVEHLRGVV